MHEHKDLKQYPMIYTYLRKWQENPRSRVFAPLAEAYRKAGLVEEAIDIAREGLQIHPRFTGGKVALARALFDKKEYEQVLDLLENTAKEAPDNLAAQRLIAESALMLGKVADALMAFKMLLYFSPQDAEVTRMVQELESKAYEQGMLVLESEEASFHRSRGFHVAEAGNAIDQDPEVRRANWIWKVETLQDMLQRVVAQKKV